MAGHSHWQNIKYKKGREDRKRGKIFSKLSDQISTAAREGGSDPDFNPALRSAVEEARDADMPKENIQRAIDRGAGEVEFARESYVLEGYGPEGVGVLVRVETDNKNRAVADIRKVFAENGGSLGEAGSAAYIFEDGEPTFSVDVGAEAEERVNKLITELRNYEDVTDVFHNAKTS